MQQLGFDSELKKMMQEFKITYIGLHNYFLAIKVDRSSKGILFAKRCMQNVF